MATFEYDSDTAGFELRTSTPTRELKTAHPALARALVAAQPAVAPMFDTLSRAIPVPSRSALDGERRFYRLTNHNRSFCYAIGGGTDVYACPTIVFKGVEPLATDFRSMLAWLAVAPFRTSSRVMADHFPLAEGKIPGALSLKEAHREFAVAAELQERHLASYGTLARLPVPLVIHELANDDRRRCVEALSRELSPLAFDRIEPVLAHGLAVYVYYYPNAPIRANVLAAGPKLRDHIAKQRPAASAIAGWCQLFARLLLLGYLPYTPRNEGLGACMDAGNATLDGGFCDPDSIEPMASCTDDELFYEAIAASLRILQDTVSRLIAPSAGIGPSDLYPNFEAFTTLRFVCAEVERALVAEARAGLALDPRVRRVLSPDGLDTVLACIARKNRPRTYAVYAKQAAPR